MFLIIYYTCFLVIKTKNKHKLSLDRYITNTNLEADSDKPILNQLKQLNELYKSGVLTKDEFTKAKKKCYIFYPLSVKLNTKITVHGVCFHAL